MNPRRNTWEEVVKLKHHFNIFASGNSPLVVALVFSDNPVARFTTNYKNANKGLEKILKQNVEFPTQLLDLDCKNAFT